MFIVRYAIIFILCTDRKQLIVLFFLAFFIGIISDNTEHSGIAVKKGKEEKDNELFAIGTQFKDYRIPYNEHLDTLIMWSQKAMRDDRGLSDGIARVYDEQADKIFADAEGVYITVSE